MVSNSTGEISFSKYKIKKLFKKFAYSRKIIILIINYHWSQVY